ncbi:prephenate dehydratase [bacterium]|nr:prephenate dehydratase [bacterium]
MASSTPNDSNQAEGGIDGLDQQILQLLVERQRLVGELLSQSPDQAGREITRSSERIRKLLQTFNSTRPVDPSISSEQLEALLQHVSSLCLESHRKVTAAYLGPMHSYSHLAAIKYFGDATEFHPVASIPAVFDAVSRGDVTYGMVPIENSTDGRVVDTLGMFVRCEMKICGEVLLPIHHNLLSRTPREEIVEVHSKPQALSQCRQWLANQLPQAKLFEISSTAAAAKLAAQKHGVAAVASVEAGRQYNLNVIDANIEDNPNNVTRFAVLGKELPKKSDHDKTSILFQLHHRPGALADAMTVFKTHSLNLTWIESFPTPHSPNEYIFFVELTGHRSETTVTAALDDLASHAQRLTILGSYPKALNS